MKGGTLGIPHWGSPQEYTLAETNLQPLIASQRWLYLEGKEMIDPTLSIIAERTCSVQFRTSWIITTFSLPRHKVTQDAMEKEVQVIDSRVFSRSV